MLAFTYFLFPLNKSLFYKSWFKKLKLTKTFVHLKQLVSGKGEENSSKAPGTFFIASNVSQWTIPSKHVQHSCITNVNRFAMTSVNAIVITMQSIRHYLLYLRSYSPVQGWRMVSEIILGGTYLQSPQVWKYPTTALNRHFGITFALRNTVET